MHGVFSFPVQAFSAVILQEIKPLPDVPGAGTVDVLPHKPFYSGRYVLSTTFRGDIRRPSPAPASRLFDEVRRHMRVKHYSLRTEKTYIGWIRRFILANVKRHPREIGAAEVEAFLSQVAVQGKVAASTDNQALSALLFLYREVLAIDLPWLEKVVRAKGPKHVPTVLSQDEAQRLLAHMEGRPRPLASCSMEPACA